MLLDEFEVASSQGNERIAIKRVAKAITEQICMPASRLENLKTAVAEATMNAMEHGNNYQAELPVKIQLFASDEEIVVRVTDLGGQTLPDVEAPDIEAKLAGEQSQRGWGLMLIKTMVDEMQTSVVEGKHIVELRMKRPG